MLHLIQSSKVDDDKDKGDKAVSHDEDDIDAGMSIICFENLSFATHTSRAAGRCARIGHFDFFDDFLLYL